MTRSLGFYQSGYSTLSDLTEPRLTDSKRGRSIREWEGSSGNVPKVLSFGFSTSQRIPDLTFVRVVVQET